MRQGERERDSFYCFRFVLPLHSFDLHLARISQRGNSWRSTGKGQGTGSAVCQQRTWLWQPAALPPCSALIEINCTHINDYRFPSSLPPPALMWPLFLSVELLSMDYSATLSPLPLPREPWDVAKCKKQSIGHIVLGLELLCRGHLQRQGQATMPELRSQTQREYYLLVFLRCLSSVNFYAFIVSTYRLINFISIYLSLF